MFDIGTWIAFERIVSWGGFVLLLALLLWDDLDDGSDDARPS